MGDDKIQNFLRSRSTVGIRPKPRDDSNVSVSETQRKYAITASNEDEVVKFRKFTFKQQDENDIAEVVVLNEPALPNWMGSCHPNGSLYERPLDLERSKEQHLNFRKQLEKEGCIVLTVRDILAMDCDTNVVARVQLEDFAFTALKYKFSGSAEESKTLTEREKYLLSDEYKKECISQMNTKQLVEVILTNPTMHLIKQAKDTELMVSSYTFEPLVNLVFCRDQQITTRKGIVMCSLRSPLRSIEVKAMKFCFQKLGVKIVGEIQSPATLEGGDFFPSGKDLCFIGVGMRSNMYAIDYLLENDLAGTRRVAVVKDYFDQSQQRMHLDTTCNIIAPNVMVIVETTVGPKCPRRRLVDEYTRTEDGKYFLSRHDVEYYEYVQGEGFNVILVSEEMQYAYGCNGLNLGNGTLLMVDKETSKHIARSPYFNGRIVVIDFEMMTAMYGSLHCCSQVISRRPPGNRSDLDMFNLNAQFTTAASKNDVEEMHRLLSIGADPDTSDYDKRTPLHVAASEGHLEAVKLLLETAQVHKNVADRWKMTPLDSAISEKREKVVVYLVSKGALRYADEENSPKPKIMLQQPDKARAESLGIRKAIMVAPTNIFRNTEAATDNIFYVHEQKWQEMIAFRGPRQCRKKALEEFANLHSMLVNECGVEIYLFNHESFEETPDAVCVADWFTTHPNLPNKTNTNSNTSTNNDSTGVIVYPMKMPSRQREKNKRILNLLEVLYKQFINLTPYEHAIPMVSRDCTFTRPSQVLQEGTQYLEAHTLVIDYQKHTAYAAANPAQRSTKPLRDLWTKETGYQLVEFDLVDDPWYQKIHSTRAILNIGANWAIVCLQAIAEKDRDNVKKSLSSTGRKVIEINKQQVVHFAALGVLEVIASNNAPAIIVSASAEEALGESMDVLRSVGSVHVADISTLELICAGSLSAFVAPLF